MKRVFCIALVVLITGIKTFGQDYTLDSTRIHAQGNPGEMFYSALLVTNNTGNPLTFHLNRIVKNLPANWNSCFCYPTCIAPWIDTLTFSIPPFGTDSIKPNYGTDSVAGIGYITIVLLGHSGESSSQDTIYFSGSTLSTGISEPKKQISVNVYPNPVSEGEITVQGIDAAMMECVITNLLGQELLYKSVIVSNGSIKLDVSEIAAGTYFLKIISGKEQFVSKIVKQ